MGRLRRLFHRTEGASLAEYGSHSKLIAIASIAAVTLFGSIVLMGLYAPAGSI
ncbi:MAG TPA: hypothetical protein VKD90_29505 [Gemmataceae bacterium]|nr:hypothetical protein [Gemmataceae bacterium]